MIDKRGGAYRYQDIGAQPCAALPILALRPDERAEYKSDKQADQRVQEIIVCIDHLIAENQAGEAPASLADVTVRAIKSALRG